MNYNQPNLFKTELPTLYARAKSGAILIWDIEIESDKYRTLAGLENGKKNISAWTIAEGKNSGKSNITDNEQQAYNEAVAKWKKKIKTGGYWEDVKDIDKQGTYIEPMLAYPLISKKRDKVTKKIIIKDRTKHVILPAMLDRKYNGMRQVSSIAGPFSRKGEPVNSAPHIYTALEPLFQQYPDLVIDGELYNHDYRHKLNKLTSIVRTTVNITPELLIQSELIVRYYVYDGYGFDGISEKTGCRDRREALMKLLKGIPYVVVVPYTMVMTMEDAKRVYLTYVEDGYEGAIIRNTNAEYQHVRTNDLIKLKPYEDMEVTILDIIDPGSGNWGGTGKTITCRMTNGKIFDATFKGCYDDGVILLKDKSVWIGKSVTITYNGWTGKLTPNYAQFDPHNSLAGDR